MLTFPPSLPPQAMSLRRRHRWRKWAHWAWWGETRRCCSEILDKEPLTGSILCWIQTEPPPPPAQLRRRRLEPPVYHQLWWCAWVCLCVIEQSGQNLTGDVDAIKRFHLASIVFKVSYRCNHLMSCCCVWTHRCASTAQISGVVCVGMCVCVGPSSHVFIKPVYN